MTYLCATKTSPLPQLPSHPFLLSKGRLLLKVWVAGQMYILPEASMPPQAGGGVQYKFTNPRVVLYPRILYTDIVMFV